MQIDQQVERRPTASGAGGGAPEPGRILVVDDSRLQRRILTMLLRKSGHEVREAESAGAALAVVQRDPPDFIISDWMMPGLNGLDLCRALRGMGLEKYVYFILLTSKSEKGEIAQGLDAGADDFLTKPVNADELRARILAGQRILDMQKQLRDKNALVQQTLTTLQGLYDNIDRDLIEARRLQHSLIREPFQDLHRAAIHLFLRSSGRVGGDLVGSYRINDERIGLYSIDVSGHGIASALMTARLAGYLSSTAPEQNVALRREGAGYVGLPPSQVVEKLNDLVLGDIETEHYFTIALAEIDLATGQTILCQAGHPHPVVHRAGGEVEFMGEGGLPVGLIPGARYSDTHVTLHPGDRLMLYSDGITECADPDGALFDHEGLTRLLRALGGEPDQTFFDLMIEGLQAFAEKEEFSDDISAARLIFNG